MIYKLFLFCICTLTYISTTIHATAEPAGRVTLGIGGTSVGPAAEGGIWLHPNFRLRGVVAGGFSMTGNTSFEGTDAEFDVGLGGVAVLADYYPNESGWRFSAGVFYSDIEGVAVADASDGGFVYNGITFDGDERLEATARFRNRVSPMLTTGYDIFIDRNVSISGEIGAILTGGIRLTARGNSAVLQAALDADADVQQAIRDARSYRVYPYASIMARIKF
ncbi:MAG: hypothetical protein AAGB10_20400 [Pseudomonadota bacterium]